MEPRIIILFQFVCTVKKWIIAFVFSEIQSNLGFFMMWFTPSQITMNLLLSPHCFEFFLHTEIWGVCFKQNDLKRLKAEIFTFFCFVLYHQNESDIWDRLPWRSLIINCQRYLATLKTQVVLCVKRNIVKQLKVMTWQIGTISRNN